MTSRSNRLWRSPYLLVGIVFSAICLFLVLRQVDLTAVWDVLSQANYALVALATANVTLILMIKAARWRLLFYPSQRDVKYRNLLSALVASVFVNFALPVRLGDLLRAYLAGLGGANRLHALGTIAVEKLLDMIALAVMFLLLLPAADLPPWLLQPAWALAAMALIALLAGIIFKDKALRLLQTFENRMPALSRLGISKKASRALDSLEPLSHRTILLRMAAWTAIVWILSFATHQLVLRAMGLHLPLLAPLLLHTILQAGVAVPSSPGKLGVFHSLCVWTLSLLDVASAPAVSYSILLYFVVWTPPTILGIVSLWKNGRAIEIVRLAAQDSNASGTTSR